MQYPLKSAVVVVDVVVAELFHIEDYYFFLEWVIVVAYAELGWLVHDGCVGSVVAREEVVMEGHYLAVKGRKKNKQW